MKSVSKPTPQFGVPLTVALPPLAGSGLAETMKTVLKPGSLRINGVRPASSLREKSFGCIGLKFFGHIIQSLDELNGLVARHVGGKRQYAVIDTPGNERRH